MAKRNILGGEKAKDKDERFVAEQQQHEQQNPKLRSSQLVSLEYADLNLSYDLNLGHGRIRQHVNPFSPSFSTPTQVVGRIISWTLAVSFNFDHLSPGGQVFVQSDVLEVALDMKDQLDEVDALSHIDALNPDILCDSEGWLLSNPMGIRTEREIHAEFEGAKIYRRFRFFVLTLQNSIPQLSPSSYSFVDLQLSLVACCQWTPLSSETTLNPLKTSSPLTIGSLGLRNSLHFDEDQRRA
ncbi:tRNA (guanine(46)-N(7))-methyltransferase [Trifolium repens]|nr:tRNA (guanine(46)-N(7))-methyltransferase [Trifolium repens]